MTNIRSRFISTFFSIVLSSAALAAGPISFDFPNAVDIKVVAANTAPWSGKILIIDRTVAGTVTLTKKNLDKDEAWKIFQETLASLGLVPVEHVPGIVNIQSKRYADKASYKGRPSVKLTPSQPDVTPTFSFCDPTDIKDVAKVVADATGITFVIDRNVNGKVQIILPGEKDAKVPVERVLDVFFLALNQLGLGATETPNALVLQPLRTIERQAPELFVPIDVPLKNPGSEVSIRYENPTDITVVLKDAETWSGLVFDVPERTAGKLQVLSSKTLPMKDAFQVFYAAVRLLGYQLKQQTNGSFKIEPIQGE